MKLPHPVLLLLAGTAFAAILTWLLPAGVFTRIDDPATGRRVPVAGTYHRVAAQPVTPFQAVVAVPRGVIAAADVVAVILFVGGAWYVLEQLGALMAVLDWLVAAVGGRSVLVVAVVSIFFGVMGALENMQEEIIPLVPVLLLMGRRVGLDPIAVVAMSAGAAMVGSAFGPTNPFQAGIALKLAQEPALAGADVRTAMLVAGLAIWMVMTVWHARRNPMPIDSRSPVDRTPTRPGARQKLALVALLLPMAAYVYGALRLGWTFNELAGAFLVGGAAAGLIGGFGAARTTRAYLEGMQALVPAAVLVGIARSISIVLEDGQVVDTLLNGLAAPLSHLPPALAAALMVPFHAIVHVAVPSISGQAVLTMPLMVPLSDLLHVPRQAAVLAYETGGGLMELLTPTNGALMAVLLAAGVPYQRWLRFAGAAAGAQVIVGAAGIAWFLAARG